MIVSALAILGGVVALLAVCRVAWRERKETARQDALRGHKR